MVGGEPLYCVGGAPNSSCGHCWVECDNRSLEPSTFDLYHYKYVPYHSPPKTYSTTKEFVDNVDLSSPFYIDWKKIKTKLKSIGG
jgi:hypothetical protein